MKIRTTKVLLPLLLIQIILRRMKNEESIEVLETEEVTIEDVEDEDGVQLKQLVTNKIIFGW